MSITGTPLLDHAQCLALLAACPYGRLVFTEQALPVVVPVSCLLDPDGLVIGDGGDRRLDHLGDGDVVVFQADRPDPRGRCTESVAVTGHVERIRDPAEIGRLSAAASEGRWHPGADERVLRLTPAVVHGRRYRLLPG
ncbi:pyridoxamine 5'-phosphate oxidase family protein [Streptacidiphilus neutrinimicus]|uniref:pyridoxamine 5'-phosphate oxidase family protein n=1 Tax=Streptacidiphilus neutrinimicus TaxID=105420 RepID=UPI0005A834FA|nr:pyridoxamine 5'-phosphate oxidase family protein [Streptacidiphilus neutrinimicus]